MTGIETCRYFSVLKYREDSKCSNGKKEKEKKDHIVGR